jgi:hypothetical protein
MAVTPAPTGFLTCHVLDTARGCPAASMAITLRYLGGSVGEPLEAPLIVGEFVTNADGRLDGGPALKGEAFKEGQYEWTFQVVSAPQPGNSGAPRAPRARAIHHWSLRPVSAPCCLEGGVVTSVTRRRGWVCDVFACTPLARRGSISRWRGCLPQGRHSCPRYRWCVRSPPLFRHRHAHAWARMKRGSCLIEAPWLVNGGHGAPLKQPCGAGWSGAAA